MSIFCDHSSIAYEKTEMEISTGGSEAWNHSKDFVMHYLLATAPSKREAEWKFFSVRAG